MDNEVMVVLRQIQRQSEQQIKLMERQDERSYKQLQCMEEVRGQSQRQLEQLRALGEQTDHVVGQLTKQSDQLDELLRLMSERNELVNQQNDLLRVLVFQLKCSTGFGPIEPESLGDIFGSVAQKLMQFQSRTMAQSQPKPRAADLFE